MKITFAEGDGPVARDANYRRMMRELHHVACKGAELDPEALSALEKREAEALQTKARQKHTPEAEPTRSAKRARKVRPSADDDDDDSVGGEDNDGSDKSTANSGDEDNDNDNDEDDESKLQPSFIKDALDDEEEDFAVDGDTQRAHQSSDANASSEWRRARRSGGVSASATGATTTAAAAAAEPAERLDSAYYEKVQALFEGQADVGMQNTLPIIWIQNMVVTVLTDMFLNINFLLPHLQRFGVYQNKKRFIAMTQRTRDPRSSTLSFRNGKFVNTGSRTVEDARMSIQSLINKIAAVEAQTAPGVVVRPYRDMTIRRCTVHNIVGSTTVPFPIDLAVLAKYPFVYYFKLLFVGAIVTVYGISQHEKDRKVKALVFGTGNIVFTGAKTTDHILAVFKLLYPYVSRAAVQSSAPAEVRTSAQRRRRVDADKRKANALPAGSKSVIQLSADYLVDEFRAVNDGRETGQQLLERERAQNEGTLASLSASSMNIVAINSMQRSSDATVSLSRSVDSLALASADAASADAITTSTSTQRFRRHLPPGSKSKIPLKTKSLDTRMARALITD